MTANDLPQVLEIERTSFPSPWSPTSFLLCIRSGYLCRILERDRQIIGYGLVSVARETAHLLNLCIHPSWHGRGCGKALLAHLLDLARSRGAQYIYLEVRPSNQTALHLYSSMGFREVGVRKNYYAEKPRIEDALVLLADLNESAAKSVP